MGEVAEFPGDPRVSPIVLDEATVRDRLNAGRPTELPPTDRYLPDEQLFIRLPAGYTPRRPAGLVVWIDPTDSGRPPEGFSPAADAMNLIMIGAADAGNPRLATDRYQLALDAVASASSRFHIDPARVYVTGVAGGGGISSGRAVVLPDRFAGRVASVGVNHTPLAAIRLYNRSDSVRSSIWNCLAMISTRSMARRVVAFLAASSRWNCAKKFGLYAANRRACSTPSCPTSTTRCIARFAAQ